MPENTPFCSQCGAPQIRVSVNRGDEPAGSAPPNPIAVVPETSRVMWGLAFPRALLAGVLGTIVLIIFQFLLPPLLVLLLLVPFTGAMAVWFYRARDPLVNGGKGFRIGMVAGFMLFIVNVLLAALAFVVDRTRALEQIKRQFQEAAQRSTDPNQQQMLRNMVERPEALIGFVVVAGVISLVLFVLFCGIGGAIAGRSARHG